MYTRLSIALFNILFMYFLFTYTNSRAIPPFPTTTILSAWAKFFWKACIKKGKMSLRACSLTLINHILSSIFLLLILIFPDYWCTSSYAETCTRSYCCNKQQFQFHFRFFESITAFFILKVQLHLMNGSSMLQNSSAHPASSNSEDL